MDRVLAERRVVAALHRAVVVRHANQVVPAGAQRLVPAQLGRRNVGRHVELLQRKLDVVLLLFVDRRDGLRVGVEPLEVDHQNRGKPRDGQLLDRLLVALALGTAPAADVFAVEVHLQTVLRRAKSKNCRN